MQSVDCWSWGRERRADRGAILAFLPLRAADRSLITPDRETSRPREQEGACEKQVNFSLNRGQDRKDLQTLLTARI